MSVVSWADIEGPIHSCQDIPIPRPFPDSDAPKNIQILYGGNPVTSTITTCAGRWVTLQAGGGDDFDLGLATDQNSCDYDNGGGGCYANEECSSLWCNCDALYQWNVVGAQDYKGPYGTNGEIMYVKLKTDLWTVNITVSRAECSIAADAVPPTPKTVQIFAYMLNFERYPKAGYYSNISPSSFSSKMIDASKIISYKDEFGWDPCQANPTGVGCGGDSEIDPHWGVHCCAGVRLASNVTYHPFTTVQFCVLGVCNSYDLGSIDSLTKENLLFNSAVQGNIKVVNSCSSCGGFGVGIVACTKLAGHDHTIIPFSELNTIRMVHEWGHSAGISGHFDDPIVNNGNFMATSPSTGIIMQGQCDILSAGMISTVWP